MRISIPELIAAIKTLRAQGDLSESVWGTITGTLSNQTDLNNALNARLTKPTKALFVADDGTQQFTSIAAACASITDSGPNNTYEILVFAGNYSEPPITIPTYTNIACSGIRSTVITPASPGGNLFTFSPVSEIRHAYLINAGIALQNINNSFGVAHKVSIANCVKGAYCESNDGNLSDLYLEYCDISECSVKNSEVVCTGGGQAIMSQENTYSYSETGVTSISAKASGAGAVLIQYNAYHYGDGTTTGVVVNDGASLLSNGLYIDTFDTNLHNQNVGAAATFYMIGTSFNRSTTKDILIEHPSSILSFTGEADHSKLTTASPYFAWNFLDTVTNDLQISNSLSITFSQGTNTEVIELLKNQNIGVVSGGVITAGTGKAVNVTSSVSYLINSMNELAKYSANSVTNLSTPLSNTVYYIYVNQSGVVTANTAPPAANTTALMGRIGTNSTGIQFIDMVARKATNTTSSYDDIAADIFGALFKAGCVVSAGSSPLKINISSGKYYVGANSFTPSGGSDVTFDKYYSDGSSGWTIVSGNTIPTDKYDNGSGTLASIPAGKYVKHSMYIIGDGANEKYFFVYAQALYNDQNSAETADLPTPPNYFSDGIVKLASFVIVQGGASITTILSERPFPTSQSSATAAVSSHLGLTDLLTGNAGHAQFMLLDGSTPMAADLPMGGHAVTGAGTYNAVTIEAHAARHLPNGADPLTTGTPSTISTTNSVGTANAFARQDHVHAHGNLAGGSTHALAVGGTSAGFVSASDQTKLDNLSGTNTGDQTSIVGITGTIAQFNTACTDADFATGGGTATGTNTGDQTSIVGITGTLAQFNTACTNADFASGGGTITGTSSGANTGDQTSIVGITGTIAQFNTACTDADFATGGGTISGTSSGTNTGDQDLSGLALKTTTVNGHALSSNVTVTAADVGAPSGSGTSTGSNTGDQDLSGLVTKTTTVNGHALSSNVTVSKSDVGLSNVDNTSDVNKPVSTAQATADAAVLTAAETYADGKVQNSLTPSTSIAPSATSVNTGLATKQDSLGFTAENVANKSTDGTFASNSDTLYPSQKAAKTYADSKVQNSLIASTVLAPSATAVNTGLAGKLSTSAVLDDLSDVVIASVAVDDVLKYNGTNWVNGQPTTVNGGAGVNFFYDDTASDISTYQTLSRSPENVAESTVTGTANNNSVLIKAYASPSAGLGGSQIDGGEWVFDLYGKVDIIGAGLTNIDVKVYKRTSGGTETLLFTASSSTLTASTELYSVSSIQQAFSISSTDRLVVKIYATTTALINRTVTFYYGGTAHYSNINTPLVVRHNDLAGLQGGTSSQYNHLTSAELAVVQATSGTNTGNETTTTIGTLVHGATGKTTPVDADELGLVDSAASNILKKLTWANLKATLKTYFDTLYAASTVIANTVGESSCTGNVATTTTSATANSYVRMNLSSGGVQALNTDSDAGYDINLVTAFPYLRITVAGKYKITIKFTYSQTSNTVVDLQFGVFVIASSANTDQGLTTPVRMADLGIDYGSHGLGGGLQFIKTLSVNDGISLQVSNSAASAKTLWLSSCSIIAERIS